MVDMENKGVLFTLETFIAALIVMTTIFFLYSEPIEIPSFREDTVRKVTYDCVRNMDLSGELRERVEGGNRRAIVSALESCIGPQIGYNISLCGMGGCGDVELPENRTVVSSAYYVAGRGNRSFPTKVKVYGWAK